jgi:hypothetical protein
MSGTDGLPLPFTRRGDDRFRDASPNGSKSDSVLQHLMSHCSTIFLQCNQWLRKGFHIVEMIRLISDWFLLRRVKESYRQRALSVALRY